jgi:heterodisulfide reductase subunit A-like polyferredoxin
MHVAMTSHHACLASSKGATASSRSRAKATAKNPRRAARSIAAVAAVPSSSRQSAKASPDTEYDAIIIGSGMGGLTTASQLAAAGQRVAVLER